MISTTGAIIIQYYLILQIFQESNVCILHFIPLKEEKDDDNA
jgi:hypothetical protein